MFSGNTRSSMKPLALGLLLLAALIFPAAQPAHAQQIVNDPPGLAQDIITWVDEKLTVALEEAYMDMAASFWNNGVQMFINKLAQDTAMWVASGDTGQKPLFFTTDWDQYLQTSVENAVASSAIAFGQSVGLGNICVSPQVAIDIILPQIQIGVPGGKPRCSLDQLKKTWDVTDPTFLENFTLSFGTDQNDIGVAVNFLVDTEQDKAAAEKAATEERASGFFKSVKGLVNELTETPKPLVEWQAKKPGDLSSGKELVFTGRPVSDAIRVFVATLAGQYLNKLQSGFFSARDLLDEESGSTLSQLNSLLNSSATGPGGAQKANVQFVGVFKPDIRQANQFDIIQEFSTCTSEVRYAGVFNCVLDSGFVSALQASGEDGNLTVQQAMQRGYLHADWSFGYSDPGTGTEPSYLNGYAYSNMKKMRRARLIPVGWELAAIKARQINLRVSLADVLAGFAETGSPFYHLVDPNWVLKIPVQRCAARAPSQIVLPDSPQRAQTCVDIQDCIAYGSNGECLAWGYCTNEKRAWTFPAEQCAEQFATCEQLTETEGNGSTNLWLTKTLDYQGCNAESAGCTWYSLSKDAEGDWIESDRVYLNGQTQECDAGDAGCREYIRMVSATNLLRNSSFEDDAGHNYVLGAGNQTSDDNIPDGWTPRSVDVDLFDGGARDGSLVVELQSQASTTVCNPGLQYTAPISSFEVGQSYVLSGHVRTDKTASRDIRLSFQTLNLTVASVGEDWKPFAFSFVMPATTNNYNLILGANNGVCDNSFADVAVLYDAVKLEKGGQSSVFTAYGAVNTINLKNAPACTFEEVGCQSYKPANDPANPITGVITGANLCPKECANYDTYEQRPTDIEPARFENFIPSTARSCTAAQVGCQEYTNLDVVSSGGEGLEYYSSIRHCEKPQAQCSAYFAWEGSDVTGFQLVSYDLFASSVDGSGAPKTTDGSVTCDPKDSNCRELVASDGTRSFRNLTKTITCSEACVPLRAGPNLVNQAECVARLGTWDALVNRCVFNVIPSESRSCAAAATGCREYIGNTGRNVAIVFNETFEDGDAQGWSAGTISTESTTVGGHSLKLGGNTNTIAVTTNIALPNVVAGKAYEVELFAKGSVSDFMTVTAWLGTGQSSQERLGGFVSGTKQWNTYKVGPLSIPAGATGPFKLFIDVSGSSSKPDALSLFIDNINVRQLKSSTYLVRNSWSTPNTCDTNPPLSNGSAGRTMLGCKEYEIDGDESSQKVYATGFARLCSKDKIGCEAVIDTFNSDAPYREIFQAGDQAEVTVPEDRVRFVINRAEFNCEEEFKGCMEVGKPEISADGEVTGYTSSYLINDPDQYQKILCKEESLFCRTFQTSASTILYAKHPGRQQCEYRAVKGAFPPRNAWFKIGDTTEEENPQDCVEAENNSYARRCESQDVSCTQFIEPITEQSYFYRKNTLRNNGKQCNGLVNWKEGCVLFDDISDRSKLFKSGESEDFAGAPEGCQTNDVGCNTNVLLRVALDRQCSQWLAGVSTSRYYDQSSSQYKTTSYSLGRCLEADPINPTICRKWDNSQDKPTLSEGQYKERDVSWAGEDYTGYSIPNQYPVETLRQRSISLDDENNPSDFRLTHLSNPGKTCQTNKDCAPDVCRLLLNPNSGTYEGRCYTEQGIDGRKTVAAPLCRGYPEADAPFPYTLADFATPQDERNPNQIVSKRAQYKNANIAENGEDVECSYHKAYYSGQARFYGIDTFPPSKITVDGTESKFSRKDTFIGWQGYCLEEDPSRQINGNQKENACLTWYPVDVIQGALDFNNNTQSAGYTVQADRNNYCVEATMAEYRTAAQFCRSCPSGYKQVGKSKSSTCKGSNNIFRQGLDPNNPLVYTFIGSIIFGISEGVNAFDSNKKYAKVDCEPIQGEGWYPYDNGLQTGFRGYMEQLGIMCSKLASVQSPSGKNRAATTTLLGKQLPGAKQEPVEDLGWSYDQQNTPFGAASPGTPRLEDLTEPLLVRDPFNFAHDCKNCKTTPGQPFGVCQDDTKDKDKQCFILPNAGSPYALNAPLDTDINNVTVPIRSLNALPTDKPQPYPKSETYKEGMDRLAVLFGRSYGVWQWQDVKSVCVGTCVGGLSAGLYCDSDTQCGESNPAIVYQCTGDPVGKAYGTCVGGVNSGQDCTSDAACAYPGTGSIHQCVAVTGPEQDPSNPEFVCADGPWVGISCQSLADCGEEEASGFCSFERRCQAKDSTGSVITGLNSGKPCVSADQCNQPGACGVTGCSTDQSDATVNVCSGKKAGEACGDSESINRYARIPANKPATGWDVKVIAASRFPQVRPVVLDPTSVSGFNEGAATGFAVNSATSGTLGAQGGRAPVTVSFYAYNEDGEQMPLRLVMVDWGDDSDPAESRGSFKNHKHVCRSFCSNQLGTACKSNTECRTNDDPTATCLPYNFGDSDGACTDDTATTNGFFTFSYTYNCEGASACVYKPTVLVKDNWGATTIATFPGEIVVQPAP